MPWFRAYCWRRWPDEGVRSAAEWPLRFPIQDVYRKDGRRIFAGRVESGTIRIGDQLVFSPHNKTARVATIERWAAPATESASAGESIGITLTDHIFIERGHIASHERTPGEHRWGRNILIGRSRWKGARIGLNGTQMWSPGRGGRERNRCGDP